MDARSKRHRRYPPSDYATPYEKLQSPGKAEQYLKTNLTLAQLDQIASRMSDTACAKRMGAAKSKPFPPRFL